MKKLITLTVLSLLVACGKSGGGGGDTTISDPTGRNNGINQRGTHSGRYSNRAANTIVKFNISQAHTFCAGGAFTISPGQEMSLAQARELFGSYIDNNSNDRLYLDTQIADQVTFDPETGVRDTYPNGRSYTGWSLGGYRATRD